MLAFPAIWLFWHFAGESPRRPANCRFYRETGQATSVNWNSKTP